MRGPALGRDPGVQHPGLCGALCPLGAAQPDVPLEVLIVDDGSTDDSGAVCDALAAEDSRVTVIHKPNGGLSDARNCGLCHAQGEYILFMDGDDWLTENVCHGLLQMALQTRPMWSSARCIFCARNR